MLRRRLGVVVTVAASVALLFGAVVAPAHAGTASHGLKVRAWNLESDASIMNEWSSRNRKRPTCFAGTTSQIDFSWSDGPVLGCNSSYVLVYFSGSITVPISDDYTFANRSDDGVVLRIDNQIVINNWSDQGPVDPPGFNGNGSISLAAKKRYRIELWYYERGGGAELHLYATQGLGNPTELVPSAWLSTR